MKNRATPSRPPACYIARRQKNQQPVQRPLDLPQRRHRLGGRSVFGQRGAGKTLAAPPPLSAAPCAAKIALRRPVLPPVISHAARKINSLRKDRLRFPSAAIALVVVPCLGNAAQGNLPPRLRRFQPHPARQKTRKFRLACVKILYRRIYLCYYLV